MRAKPTQLSVIAVAALAIVAVAAVMMLAGGNPAQATTTESLAPDSGGGHVLPQQTDPTPNSARHATPEHCPGETGNTNATAARVVDSGHIALFDVWWNPVEGELTNTSCPPTITHVPAQKGGPGQPATPARDDRYTSDINIAETVIHIPSSAAVTLSETNYPREKYEEVWVADDAENPSGDGDRKVWVLPACPPEGPSDSSLCIGFSAALLNPADWTNAPGSSDVTVDYHIDHVHQIDIDKQDPRYVLAYDVSDDATETPYKPIWNTSDADVNVMSVEPGEYERPMWFFTSPGTFEFQVHIKGHPNDDADRPDGLKPVSLEDSVTSDVREYFIHVGIEADLGVAVTAVPADSEDMALDPGDDVTITVTASNAGPDTATDTKVEVSLPEGLTYSSHVPATGTTYDSDTSIWTIGDLAATGDNPPALSITATVDAETRGMELAVSATISATETVVAAGEDYPVPVADPDSDNNMGMAAVTVARHDNVAPMFRVTRSIDENSPRGTAVGKPVVAHDPDNGTLEYWLTGPESAEFNVNNQGQISVSDCGLLDYETKASYNFTLNVSDKKDEDGNDDPVGSRNVDHYTGVLVQVGDVQGAGDVAPSPGIFLLSDAPGFTVPNERTVQFTARPVHFVCGVNLVYSWWRQDPQAPGWIEQEADGGKHYGVAHTGPVTWEYQARVSYQDSQGVTRTVSSGPLRITWQGSGQ